MNATHDPNHAHCWQCGYHLRGVESNACPECGRPFDRADPTTMNFGRPMGRFARWTLGPLGWASVILASIAAVLICATSRWPVSGWRFSMIDLRYYGNVMQWRERWPTLTGVDAAYMTGLTLAALALLAWTARGTLWLISVARFRPPAFQRGAFRRRSAALLLFTAISLLGVGVGWPYRIGQRWVATTIAENRTAAATASAYLNGQSKLRIVSSIRLLSPNYANDRPLDMTGAQDTTALLSAITQGRDRVKRVTALKILFEGYRGHAGPVLTAALKGGLDPEDKALATRLLGIQRNPGPDELTLVALLDDPDAAVRAAAADAVGIWRNPAFDQGADALMSPTISVDSDPRIRADIPRSRPAIDRALPLGTRDKLERLMTAGQTLEEREAAARTLLNWPPPAYKLRYAEWGVFMNDTAGNLLYVQRQLDELPPFVHRIGNPAAELAGRITPDNMTPVWKPVVHLTADRPMSVDLQVCLDGGWPWVAFPRFDDLVLLPGPGAQIRGRAFPLKAVPGYLDRLEPASFAPLADLREGYPWLSPKHLSYPWDTGFYTGAAPAAPSINLASGIGVRWQSVIVSPTKLPWMSPPPVGPDKRFAWWNRLRDIDCSWVSSRGESDRFLYYDGPTNRPSPVVTTLAAGRLRVLPNPADTREHSTSLRRRVLYVAVTPSGIATRWESQAGAYPEFDVAEAKPTTPDAAMADLRRAIEAQGLTASEAAGFADCWRPAFFETPGRRALVFMTREDYDLACPMVIRPAPTETARVGLLWTEFPT